MKRTLILSMALLAPVTAVKAVESATVFALFGPAIYFAGSLDSNRKSSKIITATMASAALATATKACANSAVELAQEQHLFACLSMYGLTVLSGLGACFCADAAIAELVTK